MPQAPLQDSYLNLPSAEDDTPGRDRDELTPEEISRRRWLDDSPRQLAARIPNSVFALGQQAHERVS